jgi:hypothetical protein
VLVDAVEVASAAGHFADAIRRMRNDFCSANGPRALTAYAYGSMYRCMNHRAVLDTRRVTANLPIKLVDEACQVTGKGITETLVAGLERVRRSAAAGKARALKGRLHLTIDIETSRERARH